MLFQIQAEENVYDLGKELSASKSKTLQYGVPVPGSQLLCFWTPFLFKSFVYLYF